MTIQALDSKINAKLTEIRGELFIPEVNIYTPETKNKEWINAELKKAKTIKAFYFSLFLVAISIVLIFGLLRMTNTLQFEFTNHIIFSTVVLVFNALMLLSIFYRYKLKIQRLLYAKYLNEIKLDLEFNEGSKLQSLKVS